MRTLKRNGKITIKGAKIKDTYILSDYERFYPIVRSELTKSLPDNKLFYWILKRYGTKWKVLTLINIF